MSFVLVFLLQVFNWLCWTAAGGAGGDYQNRVSQPPPTFRALNPLYSHLSQNLSLNPHHLHHVHAKRTLSSTTQTAIEIDSVYEVSDLYTSLTCARLLTSIPRPPIESLCSLSHVHSVWACQTYPVFRHSDLCWNGLPVRFKDRRNLQCWSDEIAQWVSPGPASEKKPDTAFTKGPGLLSQVSTVVMVLLAHLTEFHSGSAHCSRKETRYCIYEGPGQLYIHK
jgi:hypothetical protein